MVQREIKRRRLNSKYKQKRNWLKRKLRNIRNIGMFSNLLVVYRIMESIPKNSAPCRRRNRCWLTGRSRGFYRDFGLSRHALRELGNDGFLPGLKKSSW